MFLYSITLFGQKPNDAELKTALIYNFLKYCENVKSPDKESINFAYFGNDEIQENLLYNLNDEKIKGKKIIIKPFNINADFNDIDFLFVFNEQNFEISKIFRKSYNTNTILITDRFDDQAEIMFNFIHDDGKVKFEINKKNILDVGYEISPKLLLLGGTEVDVRELYRETEKDLLIERERISKIQKELKGKKKEVENLIFTLAFLHNQNDSLNNILISQLDEIQIQKKSIDSLQIEFNTIVSIVEERKNELMSTNEALNSKNNEIINLDVKLNRKQENFDEASELLEELKLNIAEKEETLIAQQNKLDIQKVTFMIFIVFFVLLIVFIIYIYRNYKINIKKNIELEIRNTKINKQKEQIQKQANDLGQYNLDLEEEKKRAQSAFKRLKNAQSQLVAAEKMVSLGQLTSGIAHEINNPINYISSNIEGLRNILDDFKIIINEYDLIIEPYDNEKIIKIKDELEYEEMLIGFEELTSNIKMGVDKTKEIVGSLRTFARVDNDNFVETDLHQNIDSAIILMGKHNKDRIEIIKNYGDIPDVNCAPGKLSQVFMNILINAVHSIKEDGIIEILTKKEEIKNKEYVTIVIKDNGCGISPEIKEKIFEPFFTTKDVGEGTGLGLSITFSIIKKHDGLINVESNLGEGTSFIISLPI